MKKYWKILQENKKYVILQTILQKKLESYMEKNK